MNQIRRALISVSDKTGLVPFVNALAARGIEIVSTSGTAEALREGGVEVTLVEDLTGAAEMLGGRVKTLHPPSTAASSPAAHDERHGVAGSSGIDPIDLVIVNLYPFQRLAARRDVDESELVENIDIGGPAMLRAAAKNFRDVAVVCDPERYGFVLSELTTTASRCRCRRAASWRPRRSRTRRATTRIATGSPRPSTSPSGCSSRWSSTPSCRTARIRTSGPPTTSSAEPGATCCRWCTSTAAAA